MTGNGNFYGNKKDYVTGFLLGVGVSAAGYYLYKKNQGKVDGFLKKQGIKIKTSDTNNFTEYDLEDLVETKEHLEDLIAEKELAGDTAIQCVEGCSEDK